MDPVQVSQTRYHRQMLLPQIGEAGQRKLGAARVLLVGCGALGTVIAEQLVRAGVGFLRIADRDIVELTNLQRQVLFDEQDVREGLPKAVAAARRLGKINSSVRVDARVVDVHAGNVEELVQIGVHESGSGFRVPGSGARIPEPGTRDPEPVDLILDGTDNVETRYLINDLAIKWQIPWIYGAAVGAEGRMMAIRPGVTACLRCVFPEPPRPGELATCDTAGVLGPAVTVVAAMQAAAAIKLLSGNESAIAQQMLVLDLWADRIFPMSMAGAKREDCPTCGLKRFEFLDAMGGPGTVSLCGRNAVQIRGAGGLNIEQMAGRLATAGSVERTPYFIRCVLRDVEGISLTLFPDGRLIVHGTPDPGRARSVAARFLGM